MLIAIINNSTTISNADCDIIAKAIQIQVEQHAAPAWNVKACTINFYSDKTTVPSNAWIVSILDKSTVDGALGYHSIDADKIDGFIFCEPVLNNGGVVLYDENNPQNVSVASVVSHEILEILGDQFANFWADGPALPQGNEYALELCDAVEGNSYDIDMNVDGKLIKVSVSNFVLPSWFDQQATSADMPFDHLGKLTAPFTMTAGGYLIIRSSRQTQQVFGDDMPNWKQDAKKNEFSRNQRLRK